MQRFTNYQRVQVTDPFTDHESLRGKTGTVVRLLIRDNSAWVRMDEEIGDLASFPADDNRHNYVELWPLECDKARGL